MIFDIQKASVLKRISALLLDLILLSILTVGFAWPVSAICKYEKYTALSDKYYKEYADYRKTYEQQLIDSFGGDFYKALEKLVDSDYETLSEAVEKKEAYDTYKSLTKKHEDNIINYKKTYEQQLTDSFGGTFDESLVKLLESDYDSLSDKNKKAYDDYNGLIEDFDRDCEDYKETYEQQLIVFFGGSYSDALQQLLEVNYETLSKDAANKKAYDDYDALTSPLEVNRVYKMVYNIMLLMTSLGFAFAYLVLEFIIPLFLKNGQTVGKKVFNLGLVRPDCVKINNVALFARAILGKYTIETMVPVFSLYLILFGNAGFLGLIVIAIVLLTDLGMFIFSKDHTTIHDLVAGTVVVDLSTQMVFNSEEELIKKKEELHAEKAAAKEY